MIRKNWRRFLFVTTCAVAVCPAMAQAVPAVPQTTKDTIVIDPKLFPQPVPNVILYQNAGEPADVLKVRVAAPQETGTHWIGVGCSPSTETLRSQLKLESGTGLVVDHVFPDSPAAKAGLKVHDLLLKARHGEESVDLHSLVDLAKAVSAAKIEELKIELLRAGERQTIAVTPIERPAIIALVPPGDFTFPVVPPTGELKETPPGGVYRLNVAGPAFAFAHVRKFGGLPEGVTVSITRTGNEPAKVIVKRGEQSWETTEKDLSVLPEDLRDPVKEMLQHPPQPVKWGSQPILGTPIGIPGPPSLPQPPVPPQVFRIEKVVPGQPQKVQKEILQQSQETIEREMLAKLNEMLKLQSQEIKEREKEALQRLDDLAARAKLEESLEAELKKNRKQVEELLKDIKQQVERAREKLQSTPAEKAKPEE